MDINKTSASLRSLIAGCLLSLVSMTSFASDSIAYYSDFSNNRVFAIDPVDFTVNTTIATQAGPYPIDKTNDAKTYVSTRNAYSIDIINNFSQSIQNTLSLSHKPRSSAYNPKNGLALVAGADKPLMSVIKVKKDKIKKVVGRDQLVSITDNGGSIASGHPFWVNKKRFLLLDREARTINLYTKKGKLLSSITTSSSIHHILRSPTQKHVFFGALEGSKVEGIYPGLVKFKIKKKKKLISLSEVSIGQSHQVDASIMSSHHADFHPDGRYIYQGSAEGNTYVVDSQTMTVVKQIPTGKGAGHTRFAASLGLAIVTNHNDTFVSVIDTVNHSLIKNVTVAMPSVAQKTQAHTSSISPDGLFYYGMASADGVFYELQLSRNPANINITRTLNLETNFGDIYALQGTFIW